MVEVLLVAAGSHSQEGITRLLEAEDDVHVVATFESLPDVAGRDGGDGVIWVVGPGIEVPEDLSPKGGLVVMTALSGRVGFNHRRVEVPVDLNGVSLRRAVRHLAESRPR